MPKPQSKSVDKSELLSEPNAPGVTANEVIRHLLLLFRHLGIEVPVCTLSSLDLKPVKPPVQTFYPYAAAIGEMLAIWHQNSEYLDDVGNPAPIKLRGLSPSFSSLTHSTMPKMDESALLAELVRLGAVSVDDSNFINVHMRSFPVYEDKLLAAQHTLDTLDEFIRTLHHNLSSSPSNSDQLFHRIAWNGNFARRDIPALKIRVKRHGQNFLESFDNWLTDKSLPKSGKLNRKSKRSQVSIGIYLSVKDDTEGKT